MVDDYTQMEDAPQVEASAAPAAETSADTGGPKRLVIIIAAIVALLVVAGLVAAAVFVFVLVDTVDTLVPPPGTVETPASITPAAEGTPVEPLPVGLSRVFTFRDIFDPLLVPLPEEQAAPSPTSPGTTPSTTTTESPVPQGTLFLRDIVSQDGAPAAVLFLDGETHTLTAGESIPGTPWQVMSIGTTSVVMLYGDVQVTLSAGQGVTK